MYEVEVGGCGGGPLHLWLVQYQDGRMGEIRLLHASVFHFEISPQHLVGSMRGFRGAGERGWYHRGQPGTLLPHPHSQLPINLAGLKGEKTCSSGKAEHLQSRVAPSPPTTLPSSPE